MGFLSHAGQSRLRRVAIAAAVAGAAALAGSGATPPATAQGGGHEIVNVANSGTNSEQLKTIPVAKRARSKQRVAMSLGPNQVGALRSGDRVQGMAELQVSTTCLEPMPKCVGRIYHFTPKIETRLVLAGGPNATSGMPISGWQRTRCRQGLPNRNHHCVIVMNRAQSISNAKNLPCPGGRCHLNMVISAHHGSAKSGHKLVIGDDQNRRISQNRGQLSAAVYSPERARSGAKALKTTERRARRLKIEAREGSVTRRQVVYSLRLNDLRAGERLVVDARMLGKIKHLRYNALVQSQLILSRSPGSTSSAGPPKRIASFGARVGVLNGFNCTQGKSAHSDPCEVRKNGVVRILRDARARPWKDAGRRIPLYLNLVVGTKAVFGGRHRSGDRMRIRRKGGYIKVQRFGPEYAPGAPPEDDPSGGDSPPPTPPATTSVVIKNKRWVLPAVAIDEGATLLYANSDGRVRHNVTAKAKGPDGRPLFQSRTYRGITADRPVKDTEYLSAGSYEFFCTIHPATTGDGVLTVRKFGNGPVPRPKVRARIASSRRADVVRSGRLRVNLSAAKPTPARVALVAKKGKRRLAVRPRVDLDPGQRRIVGLKLTKRGRRALARSRRPRVTVTASVMSGEPSRDSKRLK
jgi:plastocyanin